MPRSRLISVLLLVVSLALAGCAERSSDPASDQHAESSSLSEGELERTYDQVQGHYNQMVSRFDELQDQMSPRMVERYAEMEERYSDVVGADAETRVEPGAMYRRMMEMEDRERWSREMHEMHQEMAAAHEEVGPTEMAQLHRRIAELYASALEEEDARR